MIKIIKEWGIEMKKDFKSKLKWFFTKRKMLTIILLILYVMISLLLNNFFIDINANENAKQTNIEVFQIAFEITSYLFVNAGVIIAVWQYYLSSKSEIIRNETDKVNKAIELSGFYKDNILSLFQPVRYVFDKIGAINIVKEIDKTQMQNFNTDELQKLLPAEKINIMKNMFTKAEFVESVLEANYIYGLDFGAVRNPKITKFINKTNGKQNSNQYELEKIKSDMLNIEINKIIETYMNKVVSELLNNLEYFSMYFTHNTADDLVVFQSLHQSYIEIVETMYYNIAHQNEKPESRYYTNVTSLYLKWKKTQIEQQQKVNKIKSSTYNEMNELPIHGTVPQNYKK